MFPKLVAILIGLAATTYCQDQHHHHTISHQSVVTHEIPKKVEHHHQEHKTIPLAHHSHAIQGHAGHIHTTHTHAHAAPKLFIPVHELVQEAAPPPKHVVIQAPVHHVPIQIPVQHIPIQIPVQHAPIPIPVHHISVQAPVQHQVVPVSHHQETHHKESHLEESHHGESHHQESHHGDHHEEHVDYYAHPKYEYEYKVEDPHTGDKKFQHETRDGDVVKGVYSLHEPDGSIRTVKYSSDKKSGFSADIVHKGHSTHDYHYHH